MCKRKDCVKDEEKGGEDRPVKLVEEAQVWAATFHQTLEIFCPSFFQRGQNKNIARGTTDPGYCI